MFSLRVAALALASLALGTAAQQSIGPCVDPCIVNSLAAGGCSSVQDIQCMCTSAAFQSAVTNCVLSSGCSQDEINKLLAAQAAQC